MTTSAILAVIAIVLATWSLVLLFGGVLPELIGKTRDERKERKKQKRGG
jgi:hypothetical protein